MEERTEYPGRTLVSTVEAWLGGYVALPDPALSLVVALWAIGTWCFTRFYSYPYLVVTARTKGSGKTTLLELMQRISLHGWLTTAATPPNILQKLLDLDGAMTLFFDEAETTSSEAKSFMSQVLNSGYRKGQTIARMRGNRSIDYPSYCPKAFAMIGSTASTISDRSIIVVLERRQPSREYDPAMADYEAEMIVTQIKAVLTQITDVGPVRPDHLATRDREIWSTMFGLATALGLPRADMDRLVRFSADNCAMKNGPKLRALDEQAEQDARDDVYAKLAVEHLLRILKEGERAVFSAVAVDRLRSLPDGPWRMVAGTGLDQTMLAALCAKRGLGTVAVKQRGRVMRGYRAADIRAALAGTLAVRRGVGRPRNARGSR